MAFFMYLDVSMGWLTASHMRFRFVLDVLQYYIHLPWSLPLRRKDLPRPLWQWNLRILILSSEKLSSSSSSSSVTGLPYTSFIIVGRVVNSIAVNSLNDVISKRLMLIPKVN